MFSFLAFLSMHREIPIQPTQIFVTVRAADLKFLKNVQKNHLSDLYQLFRLIQYMRGVLVLFFCFFVERKTDDDTGIFPFFAFKSDGTFFSEDQFHSFLRVGNADVLFILGSFI